ncbi:MAG: transposase [Bacteroidetes bacterium]|nr:transposase [Bacteroidota bacterium]
MSSKRRKFSREYKLKVVQAFQTGVPIGEMIRQFDIHPNMVYKWAQEYRQNPTGAFRDGRTIDASNGAGDTRITELERMVGRLTMENDFLKKALQQLEHAQRTPSPPAPGIH